MKEDGIFIKSQLTGAQNIMVEHRSHPPPPRVNFDYLPQWGEGNLKNQIKGWKYHAGADLLKVGEGGLALFPFTFFKVYHFYILKLLYPLQGSVMHLEKNYILGCLKINLKISHELR